MSQVFTAPQFGGDIGKVPNMCNLQQRSPIIEPVDSVQRACEDDMIW